MNIISFFNDLGKASGISEEQAQSIKELVDNYKLPQLIEGASIITADFGFLGSVQVQEYSLFDPCEFKYKENNHDYISIKTKTHRHIVWIDYDTTEPYNRNGSLYCNGASWKSLGNAIKETPDYREFDIKSDYISNCCFAIWGFSYNSYWNSVKFGLCIETEKVDKFINALKAIINK